MATILDHVPGPAGRPASGGYKVDISRGQGIGRVSSEWFSRPEDERFLSLAELHAAVEARARRATTRTLETRDVRVEASRDDASGWRFCSRAATPRSRRPIGPRPALRPGRRASGDLRQLPAPEARQAELARVGQTLMDEFTKAISTSTQPWKKNGKILKIILLGSYARDDWVDEPANGDQSDLDLLVIVSHEDLTDITGYWYIAEDKILHDPAVQRLVNIIVHTLEEVNKALRRGEYFWVDIVRGGVVLYELPNHALAARKPLTAADAFEMATRYFGIKLADISRHEFKVDAEWVERPSADPETGRFRHAPARCIGFELRRTPPAGCASGISRSVEFLTGSHRQIR